MAKHAIDKAIQRRSLIKILKEHEEVTLRYIDADGVKQERRGTLHPDIIPTISESPGGDNKEIVVYWDLDKTAWRSFRMDNFRGGSYRD